MRIIVTRPCLMILCAKAWEHFPNLSRLSSISRTICYWQSPRKMTPDTICGRPIVTNEQILVQKKRSNRKNIISCIYSVKESLLLLLMTALQKTTKWKGTNPKRRWQATHWSVRQPENNRRRTRKKWQLSKSDDKSNESFFLIQYFKRQYNGCIK